MSRVRPRRPIRRPSTVVLALGAAALVAVPPSAGVAVGPAVPSASAAVAAGHAEQNGRVPAARSVRPDPVAFRDSTPASATPASATPASATPASATRDLPRVTSTAQPGTAAAVAVEFALAQRGLPYVWGGNGPQQGHRGFDCSGLTTYSYKHAGVDLPRTAHTQYYAGPHVPADAELRPGDLVFYGVAERVHHVGLYIGNGQMVAAPTFGKPVRISYVRYTGDDYLGATRPAAGRDADSGLLTTPELPVVVPPLPSPTVPPAPEEFAAPAVPVDQVVEPEPVEPEPVEPPALALAEGAVAAAPGTVADGSTLAAPAEGPAGADPEQSTQDATTTSGVPTSEAATPPTTAPPASSAPASDTSGAPSPGVPSSGDPSSGAPSSEGAPSADAEGGSAEIVEAAPNTDTEAAAVAPAAAVVLPGGTELALAAAERDERGLPVTPEAAGTGGLRWSPAEEGRAARAVVAVPSDSVSGIGIGSVIGIRGADGTVELTVRSRDLVDGDVAGDLASGRGDGTRLVLVVTDPGTDEVLVLIAE